MARISQLYGVEADIRGRPADERRDARRSRSAPLLETLRSVMDEKIRRLPGKSPTAEANPAAYLEDVLTRLINGRFNSRLAIDALGVEDV